MHPRARFPLFKQLMWYTAAHYARALQQLAGLSDPVLQERAAAKQGEWVDAEAAAAEAAAAAAELGSGRADSDSVMGTSKAGTTTQVRCGVGRGAVAGQASAHMHVGLQGWGPGLMQM